MSLYRYQEKGTATKTGIRLLKARGNRRPQRAQFTSHVFSVETIKTYFGRQFDDWEWIKGYDLDELREVVREHTVAQRFLFHTSPYKHQLACFLIGLVRSSFLFFVDMGGGKTKIVLDLYRYHRKVHGLGPMLFCVPQPVNVLTCLDEIAIHAPSLRAVGLTGTRQERIDNILRDDYDVAVINYDGLLVLASKLSGEKKESKSGSMISKRKYNYAQIERYIRGFGMVVFDETHLIGGQDSKTWHVCKHITKVVQFVYGLTGTPFNGKNPAPVWSQFALIDKGETFGNTFGLFRAAFYNERYNGYGTEWKFDERLASRLRVMMRHRAIRYEITEFADLPPIKRNVIRVDMSREASVYYDKEVKEVRSWHKGRDIDISLATSSFHRFRTICSGFLSGKIVNKDEDEVKVLVEFRDNPKLAALEQLLDSLDPSKKVTIFHWYVPTGLMLSKVLSKRKVNHAILGGAAKGRNPRDEMNRFLNDPACRVLLANVKSGGTGINLQKVCHYCVFYESPSDPTTRQQAEMRFPRPGQEHTVFIYDLVTRNTIEDDIQESLVEGKNFFDQVMQGTSSLLGRR